jgi:hypothetical protein
MKETGKERFILTKAYEVAYALFRLAAPTNEKDFAEQLRASGTALLSAAAAEDYAAAERSIQVMECLVKFGGDIGMIGAPNVDVMMREIYALDATIVERKTAAKTDEVDVAEIFSKPDVPVRPIERPRAFQEVFHPVDAPAMPEPLLNQEPAIRQSANDSAIRQNAILARIRQSGNCRLKDIQEVLPGISERTIRYDLQTLLEQGLIERIGNAGPSVFYRAGKIEQEVNSEGYIPNIG